VVRVEMLAVGKELLIGRTLNTNSLWLGRRLARSGSMLKEVTTVDDDLGEIASAYEAAVGRSPDFLIVVGGLGPTPDDMTLKGIARGLGVPLRENERALEMIRAHYAKRGLDRIELTPSRVKMARLPKGATPVVNEVGTAPGVRLVSGKTTVFCLPGVPAEMRSIFGQSVEPEIRAKLGKMHRKYVTLKLEGILESALAPVLARELSSHPGAYIKSHPRGTRGGISRIELDIAVVREDKSWAEEEGETIAREMSKAIELAGGRVIPTRGLRV
jgi:nicotinamide-nucleotide amidase